MRVWRWILLLVIIAALAAFGWHWVAEDPGYVLLRLRGWRVETTVVAALLILLLTWALLTALWRLLRWPFGAFSQRHRRVSQQRLGEGLIALIEGRHGDAERDLNRASRLDSLRGPALLASAEAASRRGEQGRALEALDQASQSAPRAARVLRARVLRREGISTAPEKRWRRCKKVARWAPAATPRWKRGCWSPPSTPRRTVPHSTRCGHNCRKRNVACRQSSTPTPVAPPALA
jgi:uncharacterized protein HemY